MKKVLLMALMAMIAATAAHAAQESTWWGYWNSSLPLTPMTAGYEGINTYAIRLTGGSTDPALAGSSIHGMRFYISDKTAVSRAWVWVSVSQFSGSPEGADRICRQVSTDDLRDMAHDGQPTEALFGDEAVALLGTGRYASAYAGYTLELKGAAAHPCCALSSGAGYSTAPYSCYADWTQCEGRHGSLAMQMLVSGDNMRRWAVKAGAPSDSIFLAATTVDVTTTFTTDGTTPVESIDCQAIIDGVPQPTQHITLPQPTKEMGLDVLLPVKVSLPVEPRLCDCAIVVTAVNGQPNESSRPQADSRLYALSQQPLRRTVMEELTGTWCPNCPRGLVGIQLLESLFADRFIAIAIHGGTADEPMRLPAYDSSSYVHGLSARMGGRPSCAIDRVYECDPYGGVASVDHFAADDVVGYRLSEPTVADVEVTASWTDDAMTAVTIDAATTFRFSASEAEADHYRLMLTVTADSLWGTTDDWLQVNTLVGKTHLDSDLDLFVYGERRMQLKYCHVPLWADGVEQGIEASISAAPVADAAQHYRRTVALADMPLATLLAQPYDALAQPLHIVALLFDTRNGSVVNAARCTVTGGGSGVAETPATPQHRDPQRFTPDGRHADKKSAVGRLVIERSSDGTVRKSIVR